MQLVTFEQRARDSRGTSAPIHEAPDFETLEFSRPGARRLGALLPGGARAGDVVDLNRALALKLGFEDSGAPEAEADSLLPTDFCAFLRRGPTALRSAQSILAWVLDLLTRYDAPDLERVAVVWPRAAARLLAPVPRPGKIVAVARNYAAHTAERGAEPPPEPALFLKAPSCVIGPGDDIVLPAASREVDYEGELVAVIGTAARDVGTESALSHVAGYTVGNDVSARDFQKVRGQSFIGKSCDTFAPLGPVLLTADEVPDPQDLALHTTVSGERVQDASTKEMIFPVAEIIAFASRLMTLEPGDVIFTGTPAGVGAAASPPRWLRDGDLVEVNIERVGRLRNAVRRGRRGEIAGR